MQPNYQPGPYGQQPQPQYGQPAYAQSQQLGQPAYGVQPQQPRYGDPGYVYAQVPYGQPAYGQPIIASQQMAGQPYMYGTPAYQVVPSNADNHEFPITLRCPYCNNTSRTIVNSRVGDQTICAGFLILLLCWPLFWLPCVIDDCKDKVHFCGACGKDVGVRRYQMC